MLMSDDGIVMQEDIIYSVSNFHCQSAQTAAIFPLFSNLREAASLTSINVAKQTIKTPHQSKS